MKKPPHSSGKGNGSLRKELFHSGNKALVDIYAFCLVSFGSHSKNLCVWRGGAGVMEQAHCQDKGGSRQCGN